MVRAPVNKTLHGQPTYTVCVAFKGHVSQGVGDFNVVAQAVETAVALVSVHMYTGVPGAQALTTDHESTYQHLCTICVKRQGRSNAQFKCNLSSELCIG